jgi:hypothetical protein
MSTPQSYRRPRTVSGRAADEGDLARFRAWLLSRGYAETTARVWASQVRAAYARGVEGPEGVDAEFGAYRRSTRCSIRVALHEFDRFREATR